MHRIIIRRTALALLAVGIASTALPVPAAGSASPVACGAIVKRNTTLKIDLHCPQGNGITLYRDVVLDLGGHTLTGPGTTGTAITLSYKGGSVVTNGRIRDWGTGVLLNGDQSFTPGPSKLLRVALLNARVEANFADLVLSRVKATNSRLNGQLGGNLTVSDSALVASDINVFGATASISRTAILGGGAQSSYFGGITIDASTMNGRGYLHSPAYCSETTTIISNSTIKNYVKPIDGFWCGATLTSNRFSNMPGGALGDVSAGSLHGPVTSYVTGNTFTNSGTALAVGAVVVKNNHFIRNAYGVVFLDPANSTATGNIFARNTRSGIKADSAGLTVGGNTAVHNGRFGIYAPGAADAGGNIAYGNKLGQCVGVACAGRSG